MFIESISWIDEESQEAEVIVSDGHISVLCFSHPFNKNVGDSLTEPIYCLDAENIIIANERVYNAKKGDSAFGYSICGKLIEKNSNTILLGNIELCLEDAYMPTDIPEGSFVEFDVTRLSLY